jgi:hypothetical protein
MDSKIITGGITSSTSNRRACHEALQQLPCIWVGIRDSITKFRFF